MVSSKGNRFHARERGVLSERVPSLYGSSLRQCFTIEDNLSGLKSHDHLNLIRVRMSKTWFYYFYFYFYVMGHFINNFCIMYCLLCSVIILCSCVGEWTMNSPSTYNVPYLNYLHLYIRSHQKRYTWIPFHSGIKK